MIPARATPPDEVRSLADERQAARDARDFARADELRARIEAAGWRPVDQRTSYRLEPAAPPTVETDGVVRYGSAAAVPALLSSPATADFSVQLLAEDWPADLSRMLAALRAHAPAGTQVVIVANDPSPAQADRLSSAGPDLQPISGIAPDVVWTSVRLGHAAARNVGLQRAAGAIVVLADPSIEPTGDVLSPLATALADDSVAVAGGFGVSTTDLRAFVDAPGPDVDAIDGCWLAFRRADVGRLGPLDEKFVHHRNLDTWWSLVLRSGVDPEIPPRRALRVDLPLVRHEQRDSPSVSDADRDRLAKRSFYRVLDRFRDRTDLLSGSATAR